MFFFSIPRPESSCGYRPHDISTERTKKGKYWEMPIDNGGFSEGYKSLVPTEIKLRTHVLSFVLRLVPI